jgi:putative phage-type endonuclease
MNIQRTIHDVQQGTAAWLALRAGFFTASEAPAMMGASKYGSRSELLRHKATGVAEEVNSAKQALFDKGHEAEAAARPLAEAMVGGDLYPVTATIEVDGLRLLASLDGLTMEETIAWETKLWNEQLANHVRSNTLPAHYTVQMDQELLVSGAERCLFSCTDGTPERFVSCWYQSSQEKFDALIAGWKQFAVDLAAYVPPEPEPAAPVGKAPETLPALRIEISGAVTASNLAEFKRTALDAIRSVNRELKTDQDFADADKAVKWCADVEARLKAAKEHALSQTASIDELFKALDDIAAESKAVRLDLSKLAERRKQEVKDAAVVAARRALDDHIAALNAELAPMRLLPVAADFPGAIKGLRSIASMQDALNTTLAGGKIAADAQARLMRINLTAFKVQATGLESLFADLGQIVHKASDDFAALVDNRITAHRAAELAREQARQAAEARRIADAEQRAREQEAARIAQIQREADAKRIADQALQAAATPKPVFPENVTVSLFETRAKPTHAVSPSTPPWTAPAATPKADEPATLKLGTICERLGFTMTAVFVSETLGVPHAATDKAAKLYRESQFVEICNALAKHIANVAAKQLA